MFIYVVHNGVKVKRLLHIRLIFPPRGYVTCNLIGQTTMAATLQSLTPVVNNRALHFFMLSTFLCLHREHSKTIS